MANQQNWRLTMAEIRLYNPDWAEPMVQDYFARQNDQDNSGGTGTGGSTDVTITQPAHGFTVGECIRYDGTSFVLAQADNPDTMALGVVVQVIDAGSFVYSIIGRYAVTHGLQVDEWYYLSDTVPGGLTQVEPTYSQPIVYTDDANHFSVYAYRPSAALAAGGGDQFNIDGGGPDSVYNPPSNTDGGGP